VKMFDAGKTRMIGHRMLKKNCDYMLSHFHTIPARHGQTDRRTDGRSDRIAILISCVSISVLTRDNDQDQTHLNVLGN